MQSKRPPRVLGPYRQGSRWRVIVIRPEGRRSSILGSEAQAREFMRMTGLSLNAEPTAPKSLPTRTLAQALREYETHLLYSAKRTPQTVDHTLRTLRTFLPDANLPLEAMTTEAARSLARFDHAGSRRIRRSYAASTRRAILGHVKRFYQWAVHLGYLPSNPFDGVSPQGIVGTGERSLHRGEAQTWAGVALAEAEAGDVRALGALLVLAMRLRSRQVLSLHVGDIDLPGERICVVNARGQQEWRSMPRELLPSVRSAVSARQPAELLLGPGRTGGIRPRNYLWRTVHRLCLEANVSQTSPRALRSLGRLWSHGAERLSRQLMLAFARSRRMQTPVLKLRRAQAAPTVRAEDVLELDKDDDEDKQPSIFAQAFSMMNLLSGSKKRPRRSHE